MADVSQKQSKNGTYKRGNDNLTRLSKSLSWLLRHGANSVGLQLQPGGFLNVSDVMKLPQFSRYTVDDVRYVVDNNNKKRFALVTDSESGELKIRANQGHSVEVDDLDLTPITDSTQVPVAVHGTNMEAWHLIKTQGLRRMKRVHIHFAVGEPGADGVISGMRRSCDVLVYLDLEKALEGGIKLFRSANNVILSTGLEDGVIPPSFFKKVVHRLTGKSLLSEEGELTVVEPGVVTADQLAEEMEMSDGKKRRQKKKHKHEEM